MENNNDNVFLGTLTHNDLLHSRMSKAFFSHATLKCNAFMQVQPGSLLAQSYNALWCKALNVRNEFRRKGQELKWFAVLHADVVPEDFWLDKLIEQAIKFDADLVSAIVPIKDPHGATSTAVSSPDNFVRSFRLTQKQINSPQMPDTFDIEILSTVMDRIMPEELRMHIPEESRLLVNTGCFVCRIDREWANWADFTINDRITQALDGNFFAEVEPEDWYFSRRVAELGGRVMATKKIRTQHFGSMAYDSDKVWGNDLDPKRLAV